MGLAAAKNRRKLAKDPNNTRWSRNEDGFGHRMLRSQGWEPGQYLGPQGAAHAAFHTAASASHIRVVLKEDNLGLGARANRGDECTGLSAFKEMLSRLNGKSEAVIETERRAKEDYQRSLYVERKFGNMRFVSGGFLVGDKIREDSTITPSSSGRCSSEPGDAVEAEKTVSSGKEKKKSKKRKLRDDEDEGESKSDKSRKKRREDHEAESGNTSNPEPETSGKERSRSKRSRPDKNESKKDRKRRKEEARSAGEESDDDDGDRHRREKEERRTKSKEKKERKKRKVDDDAAPAGEAGESTTASGSGVSTPATGSGTSTPVSHVSARHLARRRFIAQKRMALTNQSAMKQIFMIKSQ